MGGILFLSAFEACGAFITERLAAKRGVIVRVWLGLCLGLMMMMWFPALFAFLVDFTATAQWLGLALAAVCAGAAWYFTRDRTPALKNCDEIPWKMLAALVVPLLILGVYLQSTHTLREVDGALHVGQSTYGDLCLHLGIATGQRGAAFPPKYTLIQGVDLGYPFLPDTMATSMLLMGSSLRTAYVFSGSLMMLLVYAGYAIFAWELTHSKMAVVLAYLMMFINGGLGFMYVLDGAAGDAGMLREVFTGFYRTPTNMPDLNLRWVNVICDMMIPQRTLLAGWMTLLPALFLLINAMSGGSTALFAALGVWAGAMPMIHTHSFLGLGLISVGAMAWSIIKAPRENRLHVALNFLLYGSIAALLAAPQLLKWTFPQTAGGGSLGIRLNWVNNNGDNTFIDGYFWFWIKNVGVVYLLMIPAALTMHSTGKGLALGALCIYVIAEIFQFQPNPYDNNKLFYVAYIAITPMVGMYLSRLYDRLKGLRIRVGLIAAVMLLATLSGAMSIGREIVSDYQLFSADETAAGEYADLSTEKDAVFLTGTHHNNPISALSGRQIVCGPGSYLYYHGIDYFDEQRDVGIMLESPAESAHLFRQYGVDYIYVSAYEKGNYSVDEAWFAANCDIVFESGTVRIYKLT
jgi:hypothetical protein